MFFAQGRRLSVVFLAVALGAAAPPPVPAQDRPEFPVVGASVVLGRIFESDGKTPSRGAVVHALHLETNQIYQAEPSDEKGHYRLEGVPHGYLDLAVETGEGLFLGNQVINVPPGGKVVVHFTLVAFGDRPSAWWTGEEPREVGWLGRETSGVAELVKKARGREFWTSPKGVAVLSGVGGAALLAIAAGGDGEEAPPVSPSQPAP